MKRRTVHLCFGVVALACAVVVGWNLQQLQHAEAVNRAVDGISHSTANSQIPQVQLADAIRLAQGGRVIPAMKAYKLLLDAPPLIRQIALYNLGNLNMREALKNGQGEAQRALPLIELAKQSYRDDLRANPDDWDARYNLERALWLSPEYDDPVTERNRAPVHAEQATSTVQGAKIDLP